MVSNALHGCIMEEIEQASASFLYYRQTRGVIFAAAGKHFGADRPFDAQNRKLILT